MRRTLAPLVVAVCLSPVSLLAETHSHHGAAPQSSASPAKKFATDERLRAGMSSIARALGMHWDSIGKAQLKGAGYSKLAKDIRSQLADVIAKCRLPADSDNAFHEILHDMNRGLDLMDSPRVELQRSGALALGQALKNYGKHFDHPGWSPPF